MVAVLDELGLSRLAGIPGLTAAGAAGILAETGGPHRYDSSSSLARHAGMSPSGNASGAFSGQAHISRRGRPGPRLVVWRAVWPMLQYDPVMAAKYQAMTRAAGAAATGAGPRQGTAAQAAARARRAKGPRRVCRFAVALDLLHGRLRHQLGSCRRLRRRQPARHRAHPGGGRLTSAYPPHPNGLPRPFLPDEGGERARTAVGDQPRR
jgi:Transposase IS116/IS110/IS902 family